MMRGATMFAAVTRNASLFSIAILHGVIAGFVCMSLHGSAAYAAAPQVKAQAPGFYRLMLGDFEITALSDGVFDLKTSEMLRDTKPPQVRRLLRRSFQSDVVPTSVNAYLVNTGTSLILIDTGAANLFGPTLGNLLANLLASGYRPEQVDAILITHMHPDHIGGLVADGKPVFPNATVHVDHRDADFWLSDLKRQQATADRKGFFDGAMAAIAPYKSAGKFSAFEAPVALFSNILAIPSPGHTPGHTIYSIESRGQKLLIWGDLVDVASVQFTAPAVTIAFDNDGPETASQRKRAFANAAEGRYLVAGAHIPFPGIGHVRADKAGFAWVPIDYGRSLPASPETSRSAVVAVAGRVQPSLKQVPAQ